MTQKHNTSQFLFGFLIGFVPVLGMVAVWLWAGWSGALQ